MPSRRQWLQGVLGAGAALSLQACGGWYPRGTRKTALSGKRFYVKPLDSSALESFLYIELRNAGLAVTTRRELADAVIELGQESVERRVLSVDPATGKVREVELGLEVRLQVQAADGRTVIAPERFSWYEDFVYDEGSVLGTQEVESASRTQLEREVARSLALRLETIDPTALDKRGP